MRANQQTRLPSRPAPLLQRRPHAPPDSGNSLEQSEELQRIFGNSAVARTSGASHSDSNLSDQSMENIGRRTTRMSAPARAHAGSPMAGPPMAGPIVQRFTKSKDFASDTSLFLRSGKSGTFFKDVTKRLQVYEGPMQARTTEEKIEHLRDLYTALDMWAISESAESSSRVSPVTSLIADVAKEMKKLQTPVTTSKANTAPQQGWMGTKSTPVTGGKPTVAQEQAMAIIDGTNLRPVRKVHARDMIRNPDVIQQAAFGVCGLTSILYVVAKSNPKRFAEMIRDAWSDDALIKTWLPVFYKNATPEQIQERAETEYVTSQWLVRKTGPKDAKQNVLVPTKPQDSRTKQKEYQEVIKAQRAFSDTFEIDGWENTFGHFAMTTGGLNFLLGTLGTNKPSYKVKIVDFATDYTAAKAKAGNGSVMASVVDTTFYRLNGAPVTKAFVKTRKPKYVHWVIIKNVTRAGDMFNLNIWTWGADFVASVHKDVIQTYIYSLIAAEADN